MVDYNSAYTGAQIDAGIASAQTAVQPGDLATVATTGAYSDLSGTPTLATVATSGDYDDLTGKPTLGTAAATDSTDYATAAQGALADSAVQPGDLATVATTGDYDDLTGKPDDVIVIPVGDEATALTAGNGKVSFRMPFAATLLAVRASVNTAPTGSTLIVDINEDGSSVLGTKLSIDIDELTSTTAASAATITDSSLADDAVMSIDIDQIGSTVAGAGLKVSLFVQRA